MLTHEQAFARLAGQMAGPDVRIEVAGGGPDGSLGTDDSLVREAIRRANQGMGVFSFRPDAARRYRLKIDAPLGVTGKHELPAAKADGVALKVLDGVTGPINDAAWQSQAVNIASGNWADLDTTSVLADSGTSFAVTYDPTSTTTGSGSGVGTGWGACGGTQGTLSNSGGGAHGVF